MSIKTLNLVGKVKFFDVAKGYGFAISDDIKADVFIHYSAINVKGFKSLEEGQLVDMEVFLDEEKQCLKALTAKPRDVKQVELNSLFESLYQKQQAA